MRARSIALGAAVVLGLGAVGTGLTLAQKANTDEQKGQEMTMTHEIGVTEKGVFTPLATLSFDEANTGTLTLGAPHPRSPQLAKVWKDLSTRNEVRIEKSVYSDPAKGDGSVGLMSVLVKKSDPEFPDALMRFMAHEYGFDSRP